MVKLCTLSKPNSPGCNPPRGPARQRIRKTKMDAPNRRRNIAAPVFCAEVLEPRQLLSVSLVKDLNVNQASSTIDPMGNLGKLAIYAEDDGSHGVEPYRTDGTAAGTFLLKDILPGAGSSNPKLLGIANGLMFFTAL